MGVWRAGGGIETPYEEALQFDGRMYRSVEDGPQGKREGRVVLDGRRPGLPLFDAQPSFDCTRAATLVEKQICADPDLAQLDVGMADAFRGLLNRASPEDATAIGRDQAAWFRSYAAACNAPMGERDRSQCIAQRLDARRRELERRQAADK
ncbi:MAG: hypothetical protein JSU00_02695 [Acidobacteria bacterium]|nr:hypothetical protein [Acidobacteriota bacterium]